MKQLVLVIVAACSAPAALPTDAGDDAIAPSAPGLRGVYYAGAHAPVVDRVDPMVDLAWSTEPGPGVGAENFAVRWTGTLSPPAAGTYGFALDADDGARLWIDGALQIDAWSDGAHTTDFVDVALAAPVAIKLAYYQRAGAAHVTLRWRRPDGTIEVVPTDALAAEASGTLPGSPLPPYENAVDPSGCADPGALAAGDAFYLACTGGRFQIRTSHDLVTWTPSGHFILPAGGAPWSSTTDYRWAPEIHAVGNGYVAYFVSADGQGRRAIGAASAPTPLGPYTLQAAPLLTDTIGVIDPTYFADEDGRSYLIYKQAGNSVGQPTPIYLRELRADGLAFAPGSMAIELIRNAPATWEGPLVEAPWLLKRDGTYYLFYSGNIYDERYRVGVARAPAVRGPYTKRGAPILGNNAKWVGPGHNSSVQIDGIDYLVYHAYRATDQTAGRVLMVDRIAWVDGWPQIDGDGTPSMSPRARPGLDPDVP